MPEMSFREVRSLTACKGVLALVFHMYIWGAQVL